MGITSEDTFFIPLLGSVIGPACETPLRHLFNMFLVKLGLTICDMCK